MRKLASVVLWALVSAAFTSASLAQSACSNQNLAPGEGKFTGQISSNPDGSSMQVTYGNQTVTVRYGSATTVCQNGQPGSADVLARGQSVSAYGPRHGNEIDATRIFVAVPAGARAPNAQPLPNPPPPIRRNPGQPPNAQQAPVTRTGPAEPPITHEVAIPAMRLGAVAGSVILTGGTHAQAMQRLHVVRTYSLPSLRSNSQVALGESKVDFQPMLGNRQALFNLADRLRALPQHVEVRENTSEISEVDQGLVIHHVLTYRILPGKCADANAKAQLAQAGVQCFTRGTVNEHISEFSRPGSVRYVADAGKRQAAIAAYQKNEAQEEAEANKGIAQLKSALANPAQRAAIVAQVGEAEAARLSTLSDEDLKEELINSGVQHFEDTMFVPKVASSNYLHPQLRVVPVGSSGEMSATQQLMSGGARSTNFPKLLRVVPARSVSVGAGADKPGDADLGTNYFLTGFTIGNDYEWSWGAQVTIDWCIVGCSATYGLELYAGFNYGFGLRFLIQTDLKYQATAQGNSAAATLTADVVPVQGNTNEFSQTGLDPSQMFGAKEIVAQIGFNAGFDLSLPGLNVNPNFQLGVDFTQYLPPEYKNGYFTPPAPGSGGINSVLTLDQLDLLGGLLNYGVAGGQLIPIAKINLHSNKLQLTLHDETQNRQTELTHSPQTVPVAVATGAGQDSSHFSLGNPVYNLQFTITPGLNPRVFVDIAVWSDSWGPQIWFPQLAINLPPGGIDFSCHAGTTCVLDFQTTYNPGTGSVSGSGRDVTKERQAAYNILHGAKCGGDEQDANYSCPVKGGLYVLCETMLKNGAVASCTPVVLKSVDDMLRHGKCSGNNANYSCPKDMFALCNTFLKNQEVLSCKQQ